MLLAAILNHSVKIAPYSFCKEKGFSYIVSMHNSSYCFNYIYLNYPYYNMHSFLASSLQKIASQHSKLEAKLEQAKEEQKRAVAKVQQLCKAKHQQIEHITKAVEIGLDSIEALEATKRSKAMALNASSSMDQDVLFANIVGLSSKLPPLGVPIAFQHYRFVFLSLRVKNSQQS